MDPSFSDELALLRRKWSKQLRLSLREAYGGRMPSLSTVSRDLALSSLHLPQVSNETVRKWMRGDSIPSAVAILALADWLGDDILWPLKTAEGNRSQNGASNAAYKLAYVDPVDLQGLDELVTSLRRLSPKEQALVFSLVQALSAPKSRF